MTDTNQASTRTQTSDSARAGAELSGNTRDVVVELLAQHEALLKELRWAYGQLERVQDVDIAALKQRVSELEAGRTLSRPAAPVPSGFAASARKRIEFTLQHPDRAARVAGRKLARPFEMVARKAGLNR